MRFMILGAAVVLAFAACNPTEPTEEAKTATPEELGQDDPNIPFTPAPVGPPRTYEAMSRTAMAITGNITVIPTPQTGPNMPPGAKFTTEKGWVFITTLMLGGALQGTPQFDWKPVLFNPNGEVDPAEIDMYSVENYAIPPNQRDGGLCGRGVTVSFLATYIVRSPGAEDMTIAAFQGDQWPPKDETALCGTFTYANVR